MMLWLVIYVCPFVSDSRWDWKRRRTLSATVLIVIIQDLHQNNNSMNLQTTIHLFYYCIYYLSFQVDTARMDYLNAACVHLVTLLLLLTT